MFILLPPTYAATVAADARHADAADAFSLTLMIYATTPLAATPRFFHVALPISVYAATAATLPPPLQPFHFVDIRYADAVAATSFDDGLRLRHRRSSPILSAAADAADTVLIRLIFSLFRY